MLLISVCIVIAVPYITLCGNCLPHPTTKDQGFQHFHARVIITEARTSHCLYTRFKKKLSFKNFEICEITSSRIVPKHTNII